MSNPQDERMAFDYLHWNVQGVGEEERPRPHGYWYRNRVYYSGDVAITRFVISGRNKILLIKHGGLTIDPVYQKKFGSLNVPDLGVFSRHEDDMLPDAEMHERMRYIMLQSVREFTRLHIEPMADKTLTEVTAYVDPVANARSRMHHLYTQHDRYSTTFGLRWKPLPEMYREQMNRTLQMKIDRWNDPTAMAKRTRAKARKLAVKALAADD